jgi:putative endonuclease
MYFCRGELAEWSIAAVLKTVDLHGSGGSSKGIPLGESLTLRRSRLSQADSLFCFLPGNSIFSSPIRFAFFMPYFAYILKSLSHGTYYYGSTADVEERLKIHNKGKVRYTKGRRPWILHYKESFTSRSEAFKREQFFKSVEGNLYLKAQRLI